ncbi:MAG: hypothetical protein H6581_02635 [Bacteroidia bacterium]|nr:hypothetical protein [Bacteroidia bacterium]
MPHLLLIAAFICLFTSVWAGNEPNQPWTPPTCRKGKVIVLQEKIKIQDELKLVLNGKLASTGDCISTVKLGLLKRNHLNSWDTLVDITELGTLLCGLDRENWHHDTVSTSFLYAAFFSRISKETGRAGRYCFTYLVLRRKRSVLRRTNEFEIMD